MVAELMQSTLPSTFLGARMVEMTEKMLEELKQRQNTEVRGQRIVGATVPGRPMLGHVRLQGRHTGLPLHVRPMSREITGGRLPDADDRGLISGWELFPCYMDCFNRGWWTEYRNQEPPCLLTTDLCMYGFQPFRPEDYWLQRYRWEPL